MFRKNTLVLLAFAASTTFALNDWSKPCFDGQCSYDLPGTGSQQGTLRIWGAKHAITDITPASGWVILSCDPHALTQNIRIVCQGDESDVNGCGHLFQSLGKTGKLVRVPENCGQNAFARIASVNIDKNQEIPSHLITRFFRRGGQTPVVRSLTLDTNFHEIDVADTGPVNLTVEGATYPGAPSAGPSTTATNARRAARNALLENAIDKRGLLDWIDSAFNDFNNFNLTDSTDIPLINFDHSYNLLNYTLSCPAVHDFAAYTGTLQCDVRAAAVAIATVGIAAVGTIIPPSLSEFGVFASTQASFDGMLTLTGSLTGSASTGNIELWSVGIPGLDWPGILTLGPNFTLNARADASLDIGVTIEADLCYTLNSAKLFYPKSSIPSAATVVPCVSPLQSLVATTNYPSHASVETHFEPRFNLGVSAFGGLASATVFLAADASANATFTLSTSSTPRTFNGCVDIKAGLDVFAGAEASFFDLFNPSTSLTLFNETWDLYDECFNPSVERSEPRGLLPPTFPSPGLSCPGIGPQSTTKLV